MEKFSYRMRQKTYFYRTCNQPFSRRNKVYVWSHVNHLLRCQGFVWRCPLCHIMVTQTPLKCIWLYIISTMQGTVYISWKVQCILSFRSLIFRQIDRSLSVSSFSLSFPSFHSLPGWTFTNSVEKLRLHHVVVWDRFWNQHIATLHYIENLVPIPLDQLNRRSVISLFWWFANQINCVRKKVGKKLDFLLGI